MQLQRPPVGQRHAILSMLNQAKLILEHWIEKGHTVNWRNELYTGSHDMPENRLVRLALSGNDAAFQELMNRAQAHACPSQSGSSTIATMRPTKFKTLSGKRTSIFNRLTNRRDFRGG
jgi:hypothetical protein